MYSFHALVCNGLLCLSLVIKMSELVDVTATGDGRIHGSKTN